MKLVRLIVKNFRVIGGTPPQDTVTLDLSGQNILFLVGKNNSGKSTLLEAYDKFVTSEEATEEDFFQKVQTNFIEIEGWFKAESAEDEEHQAFRKWLNAEKIAKIKKVWKKPSKPDKFSYDPQTNDWVAGGAGGFDSILQNAAPRVVWIRGMADPDAIIGQLQAIVNSAILSKVQASDSYAKAQEAIGNLQREIENDDQIGKIEGRLKSFLQSAFPDIAVHLKSEPTESLPDMLKKQTNISIGESNRPDLKMKSHGHGIQRQLLVSTYRGLSEAFDHVKSKKKDKGEIPLEPLTAVAPKKNAVLLYEEPELFLHPDAIRTIKELLYDLAEKSEFQILCATHAPIMADLSKPHTTIVRVTSEQPGIRAFQVSSDLFENEERERVKMLNLFNPYLSEAFFADRVLLVEGDTEVTAIRCLVERMKDSGRISSSQFLHVVNCGSKMNIPFFQKVLNHFKINYWVFHDVDAASTAGGSKNPAFTINTTILDFITDATKSGVIAESFEFDPQFEGAHGYTAVRDKPFQAYKFASTCDLDNTALPAIKYLNKIFGIRSTTSSELIVNSE